MFKKIATAGVMALSLFAGAANADWAPDKSVTMMIMFPPGGGGDVFARAVAAHLEKVEGWNVVVDNKPGGGGAAMAKILKDEAADGYTFGMAVTETYGFGPTLNPKVGFTVDDFTHLGSIANTQIGWVVPGDAPYNTLNDLVEAAKSGEEIQVGVFSPRSNAAIRAVGKHFGVEFIPVPVKSGRAGVQDVLNGHLTTTLAAGPQAPYVRSGDLKVIASAEQERLLVGGDALTFEEYGVGFAAFNVKWMFSAPAGLPNDVTAAYRATLEGMTSNAEIRTFIEDKMSLKMEYTSGADLHTQMLNETEANQTLIGFLK